MSPVPYIDSFIEYLEIERGVALNTIQAYLSDLRLIFNQLNQDILVNQLQPKDIRVVLVDLDQEHALSATSRARKMSALRIYFKFLVREGFVQDNPMLKLEMPKLGRSLPKILSEEEILKLIDVVSCPKTPEDIRLNCMLETLYATGLRVSELISLQIDRVLTALRSGEIPIPLIVKGKGKKERLVMLSSTAVEAIKAYLEVRHTFLKGQETSIWLFPSSASQGYLTRQRFGQILKELAFSAGVDPDRVSPHVIRHAFASHMLGRGADLRSLQTLLGHADIGTTEIYTHINQRQLEEVVDHCHPLSKNVKTNKLL